MTWTFMVTAEVPDSAPQTLEDKADDIHGDLNDLGYHVSDVKPWNAGEDSQTSPQTPMLPSFDIQNPSILPDSQPRPPFLG